MPREFLRVTPETTPGVFNAAGVHTLIDIDQPNAYTLRPKPVVIVIRTAGGNNLRGFQVAKKMALGGTFNWLLHGSQGAVFIDWCCASKTGVAKTYTVDYAVQMEDSGATKVYSRTLGVYVQQAQLTAGEANQVLRANLTLLGTNVAPITTTDFPTPVPADYATDPVLTFEDASAGLVLGGTTHLDIETFDLTIKNMIDVRYFVGKYPILLRYCGRDVDWTSRMSYGTTVPRTALEAQTPVSATITFSNGAHTLTFNMNSNNIYTDVKDQIDMNKIFLQELNLSSFVDSVAGEEMTASAT